MEYRYTLPLVCSALEQVYEAWIFTKLDFHSAYDQNVVQGISGTRHYYLSEDAMNT